ncbi:UxaA family hydrolase [uncultured Oscillibacter sp.]|uniref:UxaA family hydrolase n=1 Tax=uncultured Oscillibacter sp. TaxID=876091 RepID=UPI0025EFE6F6|nr:UxaA family hydrolase [uncultured Oscillibacter sp.]
MASFLRLHPGDNVVTALTDVPAGAPVEVDGEVLTVTREAISFEHKAALRDLAPGEPVIKYGVPIGEAYRPIRAGEHVHLHNLRSLMVEDTPSPDTGAAADRGAER